MLLNLRSLYEDDQAARPWTPAELGEAFWAGYRADVDEEVTRTADAVSQWKDWSAGTRSGSARNISQGTGGRQPVYGATALDGSRPGLTFTPGSLSSLLGTFTATSVVLSVFIVHKPSTTVGQDQRLVSFTASGANDFNSGGYIPICRHGSTNNWGAYHGHGPGFTANASVTGNTVAISEVVRSAATTETAYRTGNAGTTSTGTYGASNLVRLGIGVEPQSMQQPYGGVVSEIVVISGYVNTTTRQLIEGYLAHKHGVAADLPVGHPHLSAAPTVPFSRPWIPTDLLTKLGAWFNGDDDLSVTEAAGTITQWNDKAGTNHAAMGVQPNQPSRSLAAQNGKDVVSFGIVSGTGRSLELPNLMSGQASGEIYSVAKGGADPPVSGEGPTFGDFGTSASSDHHPFSDGNIYDGFGSTTRRNIGNPTLSLASWRILNAYSSASDWGWRIDGTTYYTDTTNTVAWYGTPKFGFANRGAPTAWTGQLAEVVIIKGRLTTDERQQLEGYLAHGWGLTGNLDGSHPYRYNAPFVGTPRAIPASAASFKLTFQPAQLWRMSSPTWTAANLGSTLSVWLDASVPGSITDTAGSVSQWNDRSGFGKHFSQAISGLQPTTTANRVTFPNSDGVGTHLANATVSAHRATETIVVVVNPFAYTGPQPHGIVSAVTNGGRSFRVNHLYSSIDLLSQNTAGLASRAATINSNTPTVLGYSGLSTRRIGKDGDVATVSGSGSYTGSNDGTTIGNGAYSSFYSSYIENFAGHIHEVIICDTILSLADEQKLYGSLAHKWDAILGGTTLVTALPSGHPYKTAPPNAPPITYAFTIGYVLTARPAGLSLDAGAATLTAATASYTLSRQPAGLVAARKVVADPRSLSLTFTAAGVQRGRRVGADTASYSLTGTAADLLRGRKIVADPRSYALSATAAGVLRGRTVVADTRALALTPTAAGLSRGRTVVAASASYTLAGTAAGFLRGRVLTAAPAPYTLTRTDVQFVTAGSLSASPASYTSAWGAAGFLRGRAVQAQTAAYSLGLGAAGVLRGRVVVAAPASYSLTGTAAGVLRGRVLLASTAAYSVAGTAAGVARSRIMAAASAAYTLAGQAAGLTRPVRALAAAPASYTLAGQATGLSLTGAVVLEAETAAYALSGLGVQLARQEPESSTWTPLALGNAVALWLDASYLDSITTVLNGSDTVVSEWRDKSGNSRHATQTVMDSRPYYTATKWQGLKPALQFFRNVQSFLNVANIPTSGWTAADGFYIFRNSSNNRLGAVLEGLGSSGLASHEPGQDDQGYVDHFSSSQHTIPLLGRADNPGRIVRFSSGANHYVYNYDGKSTPFFSTGTQTFAQPSGTVHIGRSLGGVGHINGIIPEILIVNRNLTQAEYQRVEGYLAHRWYGAGENNPLEVGHPYKLTAPASERIATYTLNAQPAGLSRTRSLAAAPASYSLTGTAAALLRGATLVAAPVAYALTTTAAAVQPVRRVAADIASYTVTRTAAGLSAARKVTADVASYALSGVAAAVVRGRRVVAETRALSLTGVAAGLSRPVRSIAAEVASYILTGTPAQPTATGRIAAEAASYTLTGVATALKAARLLVAETRALTLTRVAAGLSRVKTLVAAPAAYALSGVAAVLRPARTILAGVASYILTGRSVDLGAAGRLSADPASYVITRGAATLARGLRIVAAPASYTIDPRASALLRNRRLLAETRAFSLTARPAALAHLMVYRPIERPARPHEQAAGSSSRFAVRGFGRGRVRIQGSGDARIKTVVK